MQDKLERTEAADYFLQDHNSIAATEALQSTRE